jgi:hypothetical protein
VEQTTAVAVAMVTLHGRCIRPIKALVLNVLINDDSDEDGVF